METRDPAIEIRNLVCRYGRREAVNGLNITVPPGLCYGFFGRNGAGKTTTIKCLLNLLAPASGIVEVFGRDPRRHEVWVKEQVCYVPDTVAFYPWMTVSGALEFLASFRRQWNRDIEADLLDRFQLDRNQKAATLSKGQKTQLALIGAVCPEPEMLILDEPTSGLDPIVRREFVETVIGAYLGSARERRTVFVSTHLISEFEGLIDAFTIIEQGREILSLNADEARQRFHRIRASFSRDVGSLTFPGALNVRQTGRELVVLADGNGERILASVRQARPAEVESSALTLEEIFVAMGGTGRGE
ncbi:MAG TPA: ABC transporter ATP-binding protein [Verrucomicrobiae bacterium]|nr:ABC transporter ATP-binding protein [Verrucomicrobiae bacterium]